MLARADWGTKHVCPACASRYYDLNQTTVACPSCGAEPAASRLPSGGRNGRSFGSRSSFGRRRAAPATQAPAVQESEQESGQDEDDSETDETEEESEEAAEEGEKELA